MSIVRFAMLCLLLLSLPVYSQQPDPKPMDPHLQPKFEVATIKAARPDDRNSGFHTDGTRLYYENSTMNDLIAMAFSINHKQIVNAPSWFSSERFDLRGYADQPGIPSVEQQAGMLRSLLEERYGLKLHHEQRDMTRILVTVAGGGAKLASTKSTDFLPDETCNGNAGTMDCKFTGTTMEGFAEVLRFFLDNPIVDATHLTGHYDFRLKWAREDAPASTDAAALPGLFTAMQEQIGLKAETSKGPTDVLVIDHVEKPSAD